MTAVDDDAARTRRDLARAKRRPAGVGTVAPISSPSSRPRPAAIRRVGALPGSTRPWRAARAPTSAGFAEPAMGAPATPGRSIEPRGHLATRTYVMPVVREAPRPIDPAQFG